MRMNNESREQQLFIQWCSLNTKKYAGLDMIFELLVKRSNKMSRIKELKMLVEEKAKLEKELAGTKDFEDRAKLSYRIGGLLACIVLEGKNIFMIKEIDIVEREMQVKRIKNRIKAIKEQEGETEYLLDLYKQLGLKETWLFTVKNTRNK